MRASEQPRSSRTNHGGAGVRGHSWRIPSAPGLALLIASLVPALAASETLRAQESSPQDYPWYSAFRYTPELLILGCASFWMGLALAKLLRVRSGAFWLAAAAMPLFGLAAAVAMLLDAGSERFYESGEWAALRYFFVGSGISVASWLYFGRNSNGPSQVAVSTPNPVWILAVPASGLLLHALLPDRWFSEWPYGVAIATLGPVGVLIVVWMLHRAGRDLSGEAPNTEPPPEGKEKDASGVPYQAPSGAGRPMTAAPVNHQRSRETQERPRSRVRESPGARLFISYRREDSAYITDRIAERLTQHFGQGTVFKDVDSIPLGQDFRKYLREAVGSCDALIAVIGREWFASHQGTETRRIDDPRDFLRIEIESALEREIPVIPVLIQGAKVPDEADLPEPLRPLSYRNAVLVRPDPDFSVDMERLIRGIDSQLPPRGRD